MKYFPKRPIIIPIYHCRDLDSEQKLTKNAVNGQPKRPCNVTGKRKDEKTGQSKLKIILYTSKSSFEFLALTFIISCPLRIQGNCNLALCICMCFIVLRYCLCACRMLLSLSKQPSMLLYANFSATYLAAATAVLFGVAVHPPRKYESNYTDTRRE